jgi:hypothetical protein
MLTTEIMFLWVVYDRCDEDTTKGNGIVSMYVSDDCARLIIKKKG